MLDRQSGQITTGALPGRNKYALAFDGDRMRDKNAARAQLSMIIPHRTGGGVQSM